MSTGPYFIQLKEPLNAFQIIEENEHNINVNVLSEQKMMAQTMTLQQQRINSAEAESIQLENIPENTIIYQVVYPEELNLKPILNVKRGRPKKRKIARETDEESHKKQVIESPPNTARTRSGRLVKLPKHIKKNFKKIEITEEPELKVSEFVRFEDRPQKIKEEPVGLEFHQKKRTIAAQYRCPKCQKAYLGKNKMIKHLKKNPDHGPLPEGYSDLNFEVWNYLVDITQKCSPGQRGIKFCQELTNLLHNVQLLTSALFKSLSKNDKNSVQVDKVLGNAIGLSPGKYNFDENELYKDVTVLQLITNSDFFNPSKSNNSIESDLKIVPTEKTVENFTVKVEESAATAKANDDCYFADAPETNVANFTPASNNFVAKKSVTQESNIYKFSSCKTNEIATVPPTVANADSKNLVNLLSENSLLSSLPQLRSSVDELMLTVVDTATNLLDNSTSSDEMMNVDQFVNERFKKITEPDIELSSGSSLNLDFPPTLDLFQFHTS